MLRIRLTSLLPAVVVLAMLAAASPIAWGQDAAQLIEVKKQVEQLYRDGKFAEATPIAEQTLASAEPLLGADHPDILTLVKTLADLYSHQDRDAQAEPLYKRALEARERSLGPEHPDTLVSVADLAVFYQDRERYADAESLLRRALEARERVLGPEHPDTLETVSDLAALEAAESRHAEAETLFERALEARARLLGPEHASTLASLKDLANFYLVRERYGEAEPLMRRGVEASERVFGLETETLLRVLSLAQLYVSQRRVSEAISVMKRALEIQEHLHGTDDRNTLVIADNLADLYLVEDRFSEAAPLYQRVLQARERDLGMDALATIESVRSLGVLYQKDGRFVEAEALFSRALEARERLLGGNAPDTIESVTDLAEVYAARARDAEAEPLFRRALDVRERLLGPDHPDTLASLDNLAKLYATQNRYAEAELLMRRSLDTRERALGRDHPDTLLSITSLAGLYRAEGRYGDAEPLAKYVLETRARILGKDHVDTLRSVTDLAQLFLAQNRDGEAEPLLKSALETNERVRGREHLATLTAVSNLAVLYMKQGRADEAEPLFKRALEAFERVRGKEHHQTLDMLHSLTLVLIVQRRYGEAELLAKRGLEASERVLGREHPDTLVRVGSLAGLYRLQGRNVEAEPLYQRALAASERVSGKDNQDTVLARNNLAELYAGLGRYREAESLLRTALEVTERVPDEQNHHLLLANLGVVRFVQGDWTQAAQFWRGSTAAIIRRARRAGESVSLTGKERSELEQIEQTTSQFAGLVKSVYRLAGNPPGTNRAEASEAFHTAQWALSSEAARSLAQMAARGAKGDPELAALARERQDLVAEWKTRDDSRNAALGKAPDKRNAKTEEENSARLAALDERIAAIDIRLATEFPDYAALANPVPLSIEEVQAQLSADEALVLFLDTDARFAPTPEETFIWVVTKTTLRWVRSDLGTDALTRDVQALRCGLDEEEWATPSNVGRCGALLGLAEAPDPSRPLPFHLGKAHALYKALFGQIEDLIAGKKLIVVPSGALTSLPFHVLVTKPSKNPLPKTFEDYRKVTWLGRKNVITTLPAVSSLKALRQHAAKRQPATEAYAGYGNPLLTGDAGLCRSSTLPTACPGTDGIVRRAVQGIFKRVAEISGRATVRGAGGRRSTNATVDEMFARGAATGTLLEQVRSLCPLPDTAYEINCVAERFKAKAPLIRLGAEAREADVKADSQSGRLAGYRVLHFATHGLLSGDVEKMARRHGEPALVLTPPDKPADADDDGLLLASEVAGLKLNADWVVLSACNTAAGEQIGAQALSGLARAFFYAGGRALLVSHWPVYSDAAVRLTTRAFAELDRNPKAGRAQALRRAMTALMDDRSQPDNAHPAVWAPFVVVGEGG